MYNKSTYCVLLTLLLCLVLCSFTLVSIKATSTECQRDQTGSSISVKRSTATLDSEDVELLEAPTHAKFKASSRIGRSIGRAISRISNSLRGVFSMFRARKIIDQSVNSFTGNIGPYNAKLENRNPYTVSYETTHRKVFRKAKKETKTKQCVACRIDCMKKYSALGGSVFKKCTQQYYYYGCELVAPCFKEATAKSEEIEGALGICVLRNGCILKEEYNFYSKDEKKNEKRLKKVIEFIKVQ